MTISGPPMGDKEPGHDDKRPGDDGYLSHPRAEA
jgi:hypothetical protein